MLAIIDNYDSFTYNLAQYFGELQTGRATSFAIKVFRNDRITLAELVALAPQYLVISPGPGTPEESGISLAAIRYFSGRIPVLGVCLGHQCIGEVFGGKVVRAPRPVHGKMSLIRHNGADLFRGLTNPLEAVRYHSLVIEAATFPEQLEITATCEAEGEQLVMGLRHREHPTYGVQFHPESIFTGVGKQILANFLIPPPLGGAPLRRSQSIGF
jgi:anthranilate synthase component 2